MLLRIFWIPRYVFILLFTNLSDHSQIDLDFAAVELAYSPALLSTISLLLSMYDTMLSDKANRLSRSYIDRSPHYSVLQGLMNHALLVLDHNTSVARNSSTA